MDVILMGLEDAFLLSYHLALGISWGFEAQAVPRPQPISPWPEQLYDIIEDAPTATVQQRTIQLVAKITLNLSRHRGSSCLYVRKSFRSRHSMIPVLFPLTQATPADACDIDGEATAMSSITCLVAA
jgi:hypothetical protein